MTAYRKSRRLSRTDFADELGIARKSLYNYETGKTPIPSDLLEKIIARGDIELSDIFGLPPEAPTRSCRFDDARLAISLLAACFEEYPAVSIDDVVSEIVLRIGHWPSSRRRTEHSVKRVARWIVDEISEREAQAELNKEVKDGNYQSKLFRDMTDYELGNSAEHQIHLIRQSFASGDEEQFDEAITRVASVRRMKSNGMLDLLSDAYD